MTDLEHEVDSSVKEIAERLIAEKDDFKELDIEEITFIKTKGLPETTSWIARMIKPQSIMKFFCKTPLVMEVNDSIFSLADDKMKEATVFHELMHIIISTDKNGERKIALKQHEIQEFKKVITEYPDFLLFDLISRYKEKVKLEKEAEKLEKE